MDSVRKIAIAGYGVEGESSYRYYLSNSQNKVTIVDENANIAVPEGAEFLSGKDIFQKLDNFDLVIRTPSLNPNKIKTNGQVWSATNEFFEKCPAKIIGVTGSKGKGTTASLISEILKRDGKRVWLVGNIGQPSLDILKDIRSQDVVVYELSSFQLWDVKKSPNIAVILYIEQEHQDVHESMEDYIDAKANIARFQSSLDLTIFNDNNKYSKDIASKSEARLVGYPDDQFAYFDKDNFYYGEQKICSVDSLQLIGSHNRENACAAIDAVWDILDNPESIEKAFREFKGLMHRLQFVRELDGVKYFDDSIATTPSSAIAAINSFNNDNIVIILGGSSKGSDYRELARILKIKPIKAILIGQEATKIAAACQSEGFNDYEVVDDFSMDRVVNMAHNLARPSGVVLLSPAAASFGLFKNYADRGDQFQAAVMSIKSESND